MEGRRAGRFTFLRGTRGAGIGSRRPRRQQDHLSQRSDVARRTARIVDPLRSDGWHVVHDVELDVQGTVEHVLVGEPGVLLLESAELPAGQRFEGLIPPMRDRAEELHHYLERTTGHRVWVQAVVVLWGEFPHGVLCRDDVVFIHSDRLAATLRRLPATNAFDAGTVGGAVVALGLRSVLGPMLAAQ